MHTLKQLDIKPAGDSIYNAADDNGYAKFDRRFEDPRHSFCYPRTYAAPYIERGIPYAEFFNGRRGHGSARRCRRCSGS